ncbi:MAG: histidine phosphatase family protein [Candidatus Thiodiazotropha endolucinida]
MQITLIRHGRPEYQLSGRVRADELPSIAERYDASGIMDTPPSTTIDAIAGHDIVVCSHLKRSLESVSALGISDIHLSDPLFAETMIPHFDTGSIALPVEIWVGLLRLLWLLGFAANGEALSKARYRAEQAAEKLMELATGENHVVLVGHGLFNYFIAGALLKKGWCGPRKPGRDYWEFGCYQPDAKRWAARVVSGNL